MSRAPLPPPQESPPIKTILSVKCALTIIQAPATRMAVHAKVDKTHHASAKIFVDSNGVLTCLNWMTEVENL